MENATRGSSRSILRRSAVAVAAAVLLADTVVIAGEMTGWWNVFPDPGPKVPTPKAEGSEKCATSEGGESELVLHSDRPFAYEPDPKNHQLRFSVELENTSTWRTATDVTVTVRFLVDDRDVTEDLGVDFAYRWTDRRFNVPAGDTSPPAGEELAVPDDWTDERVETEVTCTVGFWDDAR